MTNIMTNMTTKTISRRTTLRAGAAAAGAAAVAAPSLLPATARAEDSIKIGFVTPQTGPLAGFGEPTDYVLAAVRDAVANGITIGGQTYAVDILVRDSQSSASRAADVAADLINTENVDLLLGIATPDTTNPVADQAEANQVPCITTVAPWQSYFFGRKGDPAKGFTWTYHFFWGLEDVEATYIALWDSVATNKVVGGLFPNDADGNAWGNPGFGFPGVLPKHGYKIVDTGRYQDLSSDFTAQITAFKAANVEIVTGVMIPPDFATFWTQAGQQGFTPKVATIGKALLFPSAVAALGPRGNDLSSEIWWSPEHPFSSGLTGMSSKALATAYVTTTGREWTQPLGYVYAIFELAIDVLKRAKSKSSTDILASIVATDYKSIVGPINWAKGPVKNVCKTPLVGGQWTITPTAQKLTITEDATAPEIPVGGKLVLLS
jgi:branched-chain amino acid transport system substrate-binding protein